MMQVCLLVIFALPVAATTLDDVQITLDKLQHDMKEYQNKHLPGAVLGVSTGNWYKPELFTTWQWQLTGTIDQTVEAEMFDIDLFDTPAATIASLKGEGKKVICYFRPVLMKIGDLT